MAVLMQGQHHIQKHWSGLLNRGMCIVDICVKLDKKHSEYKLSRPCKQTSSIRMSTFRFTTLESTRCASRLKEKLRSRAFSKVAPKTLHKQHFLTPVSLADNSPRGSVVLGLALAASLAWDAAADNSSTVSHAAALRNIHRTVRRGVEPKTIQYFLWTVHVGISTAGKLFGRATTK